MFRLFKLMVLFVLVGLLFIDAISTSANTWGVATYQSQLYPNPCQAWVVQSLEGTVLPVHVTIRDAVTGEWLVSQSFPGNVDPTRQGGFFVTVSAPHTVQEAHVQVYQYVNDDPTVPRYWLIDTTLICSGGFAHIMPHSPAKGH
jgi:hypothetical protein